MDTLDRYVARIEETCGEEKDFIATFKYERKDEVIRKILEKAKKEKTLSPIIYELTFKGVSFRLYVTGKVIFRKLKTKKDVQSFLSDLLI